jgi:ethanolamine utilization protein EutP
MINKKIMVIGPKNCGKTTLVNALHGYDGPLRKTQDVIYGKYAIDVPATFVESPWMHKHLITISQQASHLLILVDQSRCINVYPPNFAKVFRCPVIGTISKADLNPENEERCIRQLKDTGINKPYYKISIPTGIGIKDLKKYLLPYLK